jgi:hypothetical protein
MPLSLWVNSQSIYPVAIDQVYNAYVFTNPAAVHTNHTFDFFFVNKRYFGLFENIGVNYASLSYTLPSTKLYRQKQAIGANFIHEFDGEFLNRTRMNFLYSIKTRLDSTTYLSAGINLGSFNYFVKSSNTHVGSSVWLLDGNLGVWLQGAQYNVGFAYNQFTNSKATLYVKPYRLTGFYVFNADYTFVLHPKFKCLVGGVAKLYDHDSQVDLFGMLKYSEHLMGGVNYKVNQGVACIFGVNNLHLFRELFDFTTSYNIATGSSVLYNSSQLELSIRFKYH